MSFGAKLDRLHSNLKLGVYEADGRTTYIIFYLQGDHVTEMAAADWSIPSRQGIFILCYGCPVTGDGPFADNVPLIG